MRIVVVIRAVMTGTLGVVILSFAIFSWVRGWVFPALLITFVGLILGWGWFDSRFVYLGRRPKGGSAWRGPTPHEGWAENAADTDAWIGGGGGL